MRLIVEHHGSWLQSPRWGHECWGERASAVKFQTLKTANAAAIGAGSASYTVHCEGCGSVIVSADDCRCDDHGEVEGWDLASRETPPQ